MEEVDSILIYTLKQIGCDVSSKVGDLSPTQIIKCITRCFELIRPDLQIPMYDGSTSMSARYKVASQISQAITDLGYKGEVGCQSFLYPTENDTRKLLTFMMEKLPKTIDSEIGNNIETLLSRITKNENESMNNNELYVSNGVEVGGIRLPAAVDVDSLPKETLRFYASHLADLAFAKEKAKFKKSTTKSIQIQPQPQPQPPPTLASLDHEDDFGDPDEPVTELAIVEKPVIKEKPKVSEIVEKPCIKEKPKILEKPKIQKPKPPLKEKPQLISSKSEEDEQRKLEDERLAIEVGEKIKFMQEDSKSKILELQSKELCLKNLNHTIQSSQDEIQRLKEDFERREKEIDRKRKAAQLLNDSEDGLEKVKRAVEAQMEKILNLAQQWEKHRKPLVDEIRRTTDPNSNLPEALKQKEEIKNLKGKLKEIGHEANSKEELYTTLLAEYEKMPKDLSRSAYTKRIVEIIANIKKQRKEITKVLIDTKEIQKDINSLSGKLSRTFAVADELIFQDAEKDKNVAQSYKLLVAIHSDFSRIITVLEDIGNSKRLYRDLEDKIDLEKGKNIEGKLERLRADLTQMKHENQILQAKLRDPAFQKLRPTTPELEA